ncbi:hypothetical protein B0H13DRAFT_1956735 [Mycena leptocephala]|nr:hypothetical protein B0H13DRAFT_1956735 [Mycena leptocephala]
MASVSDLTLDPRACKLVFGTDSMLNCTITRNGAPEYTVSTKKGGSTTEVHASGTDALLARIVRKDLFPSTVVFPDLNDGKAIRLAKWLKRVTLADGQGLAASLETDVGICYLRLHPTLRLALYSADLSTIIAHWALKTESSPRTLIIAPEVERSHAQILAAFLYEDERLRKAVRERGLEEEKRTRLTLRMGGASALAV